MGTLITTERLSLVQTAIHRLVEQGQALYSDVDETVKDRDRLVKEAEDREQAIEQLNRENAELRERVIELEARNSRVVDHCVNLEEQLADATQRLEHILGIARFSDLPPKPHHHTNGDGNVAHLPPRIPTSWETNQPSRDGITPDKSATER